MTHTATGLIREALRVLRMAGHPPEFCRAHPEMRAHRMLPANKTQRLATIRRCLQIPRGTGDLVRSLAERMPFSAAPTPSLQDRLHAYLTSIYIDVIAARGGETSIEEASRSVPLGLVARRDGLALLRADGWRQYSRSFGARPATLAYLCGRDDNGRWAVRVPGTCTTIAAAIEFIEPADVRKARLAGKRVLRQGDVYAVETTRVADGRGDLPGNHVWDAATRTLRHLDPEAAHAELHVPFPARFVVQSTLRMGRRNGRRRGD